MKSRKGSQGKGRVPQKPGEQFHIKGLDGERFHTKVTPAIREIAARFPGNDAATVRRLAEHVFKSTFLKQTVSDRGKRFERTAQDVMREAKVDLLHCYDRSHALVSLLAAKNMPAWMVLSVDYKKFAHSYVETMVNGKVYTIAFKANEPPIFAEGRCEMAIRHSLGTSFVRGVELGQFGVKDNASFQKLVEQIFHGKARNRITL